MQSQHATRTFKSNASGTTIICSTEGCAFRVCGVAKDDGSAVITQCNPEHSCAGQDGRIRHLSRALLAPIIPGLAALHGQGKRGDGKQFQAFLDESGLPVSRAYAASVARRNLPKPLDFFVQLQQLPALVERLRVLDPEGTYEVHFHPQGEGEFRRFHYLLISTSYWIAGAQHVRPITTVDGAGKTDFIGGTLLNAVKLDASGHIVPIAFMYCASENAVFVEILGKFVRHKVPNQRDAISDAGVALISGLEAAGFLYNGGCKWHIVYKNVVMQVVSYSISTHPFLTFFRVS
jgi:hypothetical protein